MRDEPTTILVIEDDPASRRLVRAVLEPTGYRIVEAQEISEAQAFLAKTVPALVLLDLRLPGGNGIDLLAYIRAHPDLCDVPVIALTAQAMKDSETRCREVGFDDFLPKPVDTRRLRSVVDEVISRGRSHAGREDIGGR
jgi:CheY-like chemotaxis protein